MIAKVTKRSNCKNTLVKLLILIRVYFLLLSNLSQIGLSLPLYCDTSVPRFGQEFLLVTNYLDLIHPDSIFVPMPCHALSLYHWS